MPAGELFAVLVEAIGHTINVHRAECHFTGGRVSVIAGTVGLREKSGLQNAVFVQRIIRGIAVPLQAGQCCLCIGLLAICCVHIIIAVQIGDPAELGLSRENVIEIPLAENGLPAGALLSVWRKEIGRVADHDFSGDGNAVDVIVVKDALFRILPALRRAHWQLELFDAGENGGAPDVLGGGVDMA